MNVARTPLTKVEEKLIKRIVKDNLFDELESYLDEYIQTMEVDNPVTDFLKSIFPNIEDKTCLEILAYCVEFYSKIENDDFSNSMERSADVQFTMAATEQEIVYVSYSVSFDTLPSLSKRIKETVEENWWEFNPERNIDEYGDSEIISKEFDAPYISGYNTPEKL